MKWEQSKHRQGPRGCGWDCIHCHPEMAIHPYKLEKLDEASDPIEDDYFPEREESTENRPKEGE